MHIFIVSLNTIKVIIIIVKRTAGYFSHGLCLCALVCLPGEVRVPENGYYLHEEYLVVQGHQRKVDQLYARPHVIVGDEHVLVLSL